MSHELDDMGGAKELANRRVEVAKEDLSEAEIAYNNELYRSANNRAYYAIYHAVSACLALRFMAFKSHGQALAHFNKEFVHEGIFPKDIGRKLGRAIEVRHASDYDDFYIVSKETTKEQLETAREIVGLVEMYISNIKS